MLDNQSKNMDKDKMRFACWTTRARIWIKNYNIQYSLLFHGKKGNPNASKCCVIRILPILFKPRYDQMLDKLSQMVSTIPSPSGLCVCSG